MCANKFQILFESQYSFVFMRPSLYVVENSNCLKFREKEINVNDKVSIHLRICSAN